LFTLIRVDQQNDLIMTHRHSFRDKATRCVYMTLSSGLNNSAL
jgi:hypothetical protein